MIVGFSSATYSVFEGDGFANVSLELNIPAESDVIVLTHTGDVSATGSLDK